MTTTATLAEDRAALVVTGADRVAWLNGLVTCDLAKAKPGEAPYGLAVAKNGRILADFFAVQDEARVVLAVPRAAADALRAALDHYLVMEDAEIAPGLATYDVWLVDGPAANDALARVRADVAGAIGGTADVLAGQGAIVLAPEGTRAPTGVALSVAGAHVVDAPTWEAMRLERGVPRYGVDFDASTYPQEAALEKRAVSFSKGCYLGQEVVCMLEMRGHVKRKLAPVIVEGGEAPAAGAEVKDASGAVVGTVTSSAPRREGAVALAMLKRAAAEPGTGLHIAGAPARVVARPEHDAETTR